MTGTKKLKIGALLNSTLLVFIFSLLPANRTLAVSGSDDYDEVTYEDLVQRISQKKNQIARTKTEPQLENLMIHMGFGLTTSVNSINVNGKDTLKAQNGFQLSLGIDLFSENFVAEGSIRNFGQSYSGYETRSLREFDLKLLYQDKSANHTGFHLGSGLGTRILKISDSASNLNINDTTPALIMVGGVDAFISRNTSIGLEMGWRNALVTSTVDKNSMDLTLRLDSAF
jgi:hypothetical protein